MRKRRGEGVSVEMGGSCDIHCICTLHPHACLSLCVSTCGLSESRHHGWEGRREDTRYEEKEGGGGVSGDGGIM